MQNFHDSLNFVLEHEGGWSDNPLDPGGATMKGITLAVYRRYYGAEKGKHDLRNIRDSEIQHIYKTGYWDKCRCDYLPAGVDYAVFDAAVNSGPARAAKWLQATVGVVEDGAIGPATLTAAAGLAAGAVIEGICDARLGFLEGLATFGTFGTGWQRRVLTVKTRARRMALDALAARRAN